MADDQPASKETFEDRLAETPLEELERFAAVGNETTMNPPFHNVFFNTFVNSPGFSKRL